MTVTLSTSVGKNGANQPEDVKVIQKLLNTIAAAVGGPESLTYLLEHKDKLKGLHQR